MITPVCLIKPISMPPTVPQETKFKMSPSQVPVFKGKFKMNGDNPDLKKLWDMGKLPSVKYGFYGDKLTHQNISREHLIPASQGGTKRFGNIVLASKEKNNARSDYDIRDFADITKVRLYLSQFLGMKKPIDGNRYIFAVMETLRQLGLFP